MSEKKIRFGLRMRQALEYVAACGGAAPSMMVVADAIGPNGSRSFGYRSVHRCIASGLLSIDSEHEARSQRGKGAVVLTFAGHRLLGTLGEAPAVSR